MSSTKVVHLGLIQMGCDLEPAKNLARAQEKIRATAAQGAQIIVLPELFLSRYFCQSENDRFFTLAEIVPGPTTKAMAALAQALKVVIVVPLFERAEKKFYNTVAVINADGTYLGKYRKLHIPDDLKNYYGEAYYFAPGDLGCPIFETQYAKLGAMICWDQWFPESARQLALSGAELVVYPTAIGRQVKGRQELNETELEAWVTIQRSHAIANGVFIAAVNRIGPEDHLNFWGSSFVADPLGRILAQASDEQEETLIVPCDLSLMAAVRTDWPFHHALRKDVY